jgi:hypothetical protein
MEFYGGFVVGCYKFQSLKNIASFRQMAFAVPNKSKALYNVAAQHGKALLSYMGEGTQTKAAVQTVKYTLLAP